MIAIGHPAEKKTVPYGTGRRYQSGSSGPSPTAQGRNNRCARAPPGLRHRSRHAETEGRRHEEDRPADGPVLEGFTRPDRRPGRGCYGAAAWTSAMRSLASDVRLLIVSLLGAGPPWASPFNRVRIWPAIWSRFVSQEPSFASAAT